MSSIRFPNDDLVRKIMRRQDDFWCRRLKWHEQRRKEKEAKKLAVAGKR
jgi:hypothetical protein